MSAIHDLTPEELAFLAQHSRNGASRWHWIWSGLDPEGRMHNVCVRLEHGQVVEATADGGHSTTEIVRSAYLACRRGHERASQAAKRAAATRARRQEKRVYAAARLLVAQKLTPQKNCIICGRGLDDADSVRRGIGSDCWQAVLELLAQHNLKVRP